MFYIKKGFIRVAGITNGEDIVIRTVEKVNNTSSEIAVEYNAWGASEYNTPKEDDDSMIIATEATRIPLSNIPSRMEFPFDIDTQASNWALGNELLIGWLKKNLNIPDEAFYFQKESE